MGQSSSNFGKGNASQVVAFHMLAACKAQLKLQKTKVAFPGIERRLEKQPKPMNY